ncbi:hypothetical protein DUNSADRAFT_15293 [Dunaliella salina]|uniref:CSC1/OSCA1-like cytosolic domain-containing protein n=1 Tax=Dunaliella salina TaxID=3046 RepID=A0ABQ7G5P6_DUNSA|nr:hypothetical protein DUNSADRAFT_15293 [Dunaliella salina]|eukprot:KAF5829937.1 hypothetical protein DUNSADRAFT_15293 [Dunaliella salina]
MQATCSRGNTTAEETQQQAEEREKQHQIQARVAAQISQAKRHANIYKPPEGISMWASAKEIGCHFGVGMGLYFQMLEWLMILFSCITFLSFPFWIVTNQSVFTDETNKDRESVGLKVFEGPSLLATTFASIPDHQLDPNNTLVYMNTELGGAWYGPMKKDDFLLWISLLDVVGVVLTIFLVTYYTWKAGWFELSVDKNTYDATDYAVLVTGLPPDAGFHEVGHFFSRFGEVIDVTLVLDMGRVLQACAKASRLEHKREQLASIVRLFPAESGKRTQKQLEQTEEELILLLKDINEDMDRAIAERQRPLSGSAILRHPSNLLRPEKWGSLQRHQHDPVHAADAESGLPPPKPLSEAEGEKVALGKHDSEEWDGNTDKEFTKKAVYDTKAAFVTFNRMSEAKKCLKLTPNPGWIGWLYRHTVAQDAQCIRGHCIETVRARNPTDYIFENMCFSEVLRFWHKFGIRLLYLFLLIVCALIVSGLSSRTRVNLDRTDLDFSNNIMNTDIGSAASFLPQSAPPGSTVFQLRELFEEAMQEASSSATTPAFSPKLARKANFTNYCKLALPEVCAEHYRQSLGGAQEIELGMTFGEHLQWGSNFDEVVYERPVLNSLNKLAGAADPRAVEGTDVGLSAHTHTHTHTHTQEEESEQKPGDWLLVSKQHCAAYIAGEQDAGTETAISVVIAVLNIVLKLFVQFLAAAEKQWTRSEMEMSFCVVAYTSQLLNSVLVVLVVNARPNARSTETGERVGEEDIQWLRYIILGGSFDDFSAQWYEYVGQSFMILLFIQTIFPLVNIAIEVVVKGVQRMMVWLNRDATQDDYNNAYNHPNFLLQQRVADVMLNVSGCCEGLQASKPINTSFASYWCHAHFERLLCRSKSLVMLPVQIKVRSTSAAASTD